MAVAAGDFDGDGLGEIAVAQVSDATTLHVSTFRYTKTVGAGGAATYSLKPAGDVVISPDVEKNETTYFGGSVDLASGDFDGDGTDDLALASVSWALDELSGITMYPTVQVLGSDQSLDLTPGGKFVEPKALNPVNENIRAQVVSGLFYLKPAVNSGDEDYGFGRRQLALVFNDTTTDRRPEVVWPFLVSGDLQHLTQIADPVELDIKANQRFGAAAGGFIGDQAFAGGQNPSDQPPRDLRDRRPDDRLPV